MGYLETHLPNRPYIRKVVDWIKNRRLKGYYTDAEAHVENCGGKLIYMADGRMRHGGLSDRICGIVSAYNYAKKNGLIFKIHFVTPYFLQDILIPNEYDWIIFKEDISYNRNDAIPVYISHRIDYEDVKECFTKRLHKYHRRQIHLYTNARFFKKGEFSSLFSELFKPVPVLKTMIEANLDRIPKHYVSLTFRFQQLLGDFREDGFPTLETEEKKEQLIAQCLKCVDYVKRKTNKAVLITSDSITFLERVENLENVYIIPGTIRHMEYTHGNADISVDMKSYVDFYMLANAEIIYLCNIPPLYQSGFPETASRVYNKLYKEITKKDLDI